MLFDFVQIIKLDLINGLTFFMSLGQRGSDGYYAYYNGNYYPIYHQSGTMTSLVSLSTFGVNNSEMDILYQRRGIFKRTMFESGLFDGASFTLYRANFKRPHLFASGYYNNYYDDRKAIIVSDCVNELEGVLGTIKLNDSSALIELRGVKQNLIKTVVNSTSKFCNNTFCDKVCGLKLKDFTYTATIREVKSQTSIIIDNFTDKAFSEYTEEERTQFISRFNFGLLIIKNRILSGYKIDIRNADITDDDGLKLYLNTNIKPLCQQGDEVDLIYQCDKTQKACKSFNNLANFTGFSYVPVKSKVYAVGVGGVKS